MRTLVVLRTALACIVAGVVLALFLLSPTLVVAFGAALLFVRVFVVDDPPRHKS